jgi:hypothetical protein
MSIYLPKLVAVKTNNSKQCQSDSTEFKPTIPHSIEIDQVYVSKAIPVTGRAGLQGCKVLGIPHCKDNRLTHGGEVVSLTRRPRSTLQKNLWHLFPLEAESTPGS